MFVQLTYGFHFNWVATIKRASKRLGITNWQVGPGILVEKRLSADFADELYLIEMFH